MAIECGPVNDVFKESEQVLDKKIIAKRFKVANFYWGKVKDDGMWPLHSGARIKKTRLGAYGFGNHDVGWEPVEDAICDSVICADPEVDRLQHGGFESIYFGPERFRINSDWICLEKLLYREMPEMEMQHLENYILKCVKYFWEEFYRSRYIDNCEHKVLALVPADQLDGDTCNCGPAGICIPEVNTENGFAWVRRTSGAIDERYIRVNCRVADITRISDLGLDLLDMAKIELSQEDDNYPFLDNGFPLLDVVISDPRQNTRLGNTENFLMDRAHSYGGYDPVILNRKLATQKVWRDSYSVRYDNGAARFYSDSTFNTALVEGEGYIYDPNDPETWPRFRRVFPWKPVRIPSTTSADSFGIKHVLNKAYVFADFVINTIFSPMVISSMGLRPPSSVGGAKTADSLKTYDGNPKWMNPDWPCNPYRDKGYWTLGFGAAVKPEYPEYGWAFLTRMDHRIVLQGNECTLREASCDSRLSAYCHEGLTGGDGDLNGLPGANLAVAMDNYGNGW